MRANLIAVMVAAHKKTRRVQRAGDELQIVNRQIAAANDELDSLHLALLAQARAVNPVHHLIADSQKFHVGYWLLAIGYWLLAIGYWLLS
ncbi:MAG: hypothetical protein HC853_19295 [Anaerolineae bacterium]|nr:hypothetical protein [Anaerolineae bacterium]